MSDYPLVCPKCLSVDVGSTLTGFFGRNENAAWCERCGWRGPAWQAERAKEDLDLCIDLDLTPEQARLGWRLTEQGWRQVEALAREDK